MAQTKSELEKFLASGNHYLRDTNQFQLAIKEYEKALALAEGSKDRKNITTANIELGNAYSSINRFHLAIEFYEESFRNFKRTGSQGKTENFLSSSIWIYQ